MILIINTSNFIFRNKSFIFIVRFEIANLDFISTVTWRVVRNLYTSISVCILSCYYFCTIGWFLLHCCFTYQSLPFIQHTCFYISMFVFSAVFCLVCICVFGFYPYIETWIYLHCILCNIHVFVLWYIFISSSWYLPYYFTLQDWGLSLCFNAYLLWFFFFNCLFLNNSIMYIFLIQFFIFYFITVNI